MRRLKRLWIGILLLVVLSPLGLILPAKLGVGSAWGEWSAAEIRSLVGYLPDGFKRPEPWSAPAPDYALKDQERAGLRSQSAAYIASAAVGVAVVVLLTLGLARFLAKREENDSA